VEDGAGELALGHSRFDQPFPTSINTAKWIELAIGEKWEDGIEKEVSENLLFLCTFS
jgi:hypothetical protein